MATTIARSNTPDDGHANATGEPRTEDQLHNARNQQQNIHPEGMHNFMSRDWIWCCSFSDCSQKVQGVINYQMRQNA